MVKMVYYNKKGRKSKKPPKGVPECVPKLDLEGGVSPENGIPVKPTFNDRLRKRKRR